MSPDPTRLHPDPALEPLCAAAAEVLARSGVLPEGWSVRGAVRRSPIAIELDLGDGEGGAGVRVVWAVPGSAGFKAYRTGTHYAVAYRDPRDGYASLGEEDAGLYRQVALAACEALADAPRVVDLVEGDVEEGGGEGEPILVIPDVARRLAPFLAPGRELVDGWTLAAIQAPSPGEEVHLVFRHADVPMLPRIVLVRRIAGRVGIPAVAGLNLLHTTRYGLTVPESVDHYYRILTAALLHVIRAAAAS